VICDPVHSRSEKTRVGSASKCRSVPNGFNPTPANSYGYVPTRTKAEVLLNAIDSSRRLVREISAGQVTKSGERQDISNLTGITDHFAVGRSGCVYQLLPAGFDHFTTRYDSDINGVEEFVPGLSLQAFSTVNSSGEWIRVGTTTETLRACAQERGAGPPYHNQQLAQRCWGVFLPSAQTGPFSVGNAQPLIGPQVRWAGFPIRLLPAKSKTP